VRRFFLIVVSLLVVSFLLIGCSFSFGAPSAPTQTGQGESVSEDNGGSTESDENTGGSTSENAGDTSNNTGENTGETTEETAKPHVLTVSDIKDGIIMPKDAKNVLMAMVDTFIADDASLITLGFMTTNHSLWNMHVQAKVDYTIPAETFNKAKDILVSMGYPEKLISVNYGDYGGSLAMGLTDKGFSIDIGYDKEGGSIVIGMGLSVKDTIPPLGLDITRLKGSDYWSCVKEVFDTAGLNASQLSNDNMLTISYQEGIVAVDYTVVGQLSDADVKDKLMALKAKYGGDYSDIGVMSELDGAKCKKATISAGNMSSTGGKGAFNVHIEWRQ